MFFSTRPFITLLRVKRVELLLHKLDSLPTVAGRMHLNLHLSGSFKPRRYVSNFFMNDALGFSRSVYTFMKVNIPTYVTIVLYTFWPCSWKQEFHGRCLLDFPSMYLY